LVEFSMIKGFFFGITGVWTQGFMLARQVLPLEPHLQLLELFFKYILVISTFSDVWWVFFQICWFFCPAHKNTFQKAVTSFDEVQIIKI
jgi:hypothetical protein